MKKIFVSITILFAAISLTFAQKVQTKKELVLVGNEYQVKEIPKTYDEIVSKLTDTGKTFNGEKVYSSSTGKSFYVIRKQGVGFIKKKIN